jgi:integrase
MSIEARKLSRGRKVYRVRYRDGAANRSRAFDRKQDALAFEAEVRRRKQIGDLATLSAGRESLSDFAREWFTRYAKSNLAASTLACYAGMFDKHVLPRLGGVELRRITPETIEAFRADLEAAGVGPAATRKTLVIIQSILHRAVLWRRIPANPVSLVRKPAARRTRIVRPFAPSSVEAIRATLLQRGKHLEATLVSVLAYAGLRPGEALALRWEDVRDRTIVIEKAVSLGKEKSTKTGRTRTVRLLAPLAADLLELRLASGRPPESALVFPAHDGGFWADDDWRNFRRRAFQAAAAQAGITDARPYDLRHSFCSLLLAEGASVIEVASQAGHSPTMTLAVYGHVIDELAEGERVSAEAAIRAARSRHVPSAYPRCEECSL